MAVFAGGGGRQEQAGGLGAVRGWEESRQPCRSTALLGRAASCRRPQEGPAQGAPWPPRRLRNSAELKTSPREQPRPTVTQPAGRRSVLTLFCSYSVSFWFRGNGLVNRGAVFLLVFIGMKPDFWAWRLMRSLWGTSFNKETSRQLRFLTLATSPSHLTWKLPCLAFSPMCLERRGAGEPMRLTRSKTYWKGEGERAIETEIVLLCRKKICCWIDVF